MTTVNWENILGQLNDEFIEEAVMSCGQTVSAASSDEKETNMTQKTKRNTKRMLTVAVAAAMIMALAITGFATGAIPSLMARLSSGDAFYPVAGELSDKTKETVEPETEQVVSLTKEESYYDGENVVLAYTLNKENAEVAFDFGPEHEYFDDLFTPPEHNRTTLAQIWVDHDLPASELAIAQAKLMKDGCVGFTVRYAGIGDHVKLGDGSDLGPMCGGEVDGSVVLRNQNELPESARNLDEITLCLGVKQYVHYYYVEDGVVSYYCPVAEAEWVPFTIENVNAE